MMANVSATKSQVDHVTMAGRHRWTPTEDNALRAGFARGDSAVSIAAKIGVDITAVYNRVARLGIRHRRTSRSLEARFFEYVSPEPNSGCWLWEGSQDRKGYGQLRIAPRGPGSLKYATHVSLELHGRPVPPGMQACHRCDIPSCVNPEHLFIGTPQQNTDDMIAKGRMLPFDYVARGSKVGGARLHETDIPIIRQRLAAGETLRVIALSYGVTETNISCIRRGKTWRHVT